jgi:hypothetical protein
MVRSGENAKAANEARTPMAMMACFMLIYFADALLLKLTIAAD